ncbi:MULTISPECIES: RelA/SpoT domain-containing protein [unclassified Pseudodesulfovibrio]|uniref:RelA/SpoT domain-containing protein n=1 Tax=unclassified Pseudodesulfovibrio TaxID=2661612 RepID=UPI000FEBC871|nr:MULTISPECIES: RelA/SpoT domain-containing protein [unclassified Pseudodesulfovibrio]MCJ2164642.1 RelA/SpoT domain-containing protein [Pseudodesulfovibrio sp. S3-i]RWU04166.1 hypothetical protein DWB63_09165 [Pseudodesulfovibrio sp. S3]
MKVSKSIRDLHSELKDYALPLGKEVSGILKDYAEQNKWSFSERVKEEISFAQKIEMGMYSSIEEIDDFYGCEIVVLNLKDIDTAKKFIYNSFNVINERPKKLVSADSFFFDGIRLYARLKERVAGPKPYSWMTFEVQIKTLLEKAWGEATHDFTYKCKEVKWGKERLVYQLKAILNHADIMFSEIETVSDICLPTASSITHDNVNNVTKWILDNWNESACPDNMKRLSETIVNLCKTYNLDFDSLKKIVAKHREINGIQEDLSIYSSILQAVFNSDHKGFWAKAGKKHHYHDLKLVIPPEVELSKEVKEKIDGTRLVPIDSLHAPPK